MTNQTVTISRELLERLAEYAPTGICAPTALQGFAIEARRLLSVSAQPAGEVPEVVGYVCEDDMRWNGDCTLRRRAYSDYTIPIMTVAQHTRIVAAMQAREVVLPPSPYMPGVEPSKLSDYERGEAQGRCDMWAEVARLNGKGGV